MAPKLSHHEADGFYIVIRNLIMKYRHNPMKFKRGVSKSSILSLKTRSRKSVLFYEDPSCKVGSKKNTLGGDQHSSRHPDNICINMSTMLSDLASSKSGVMVPVRYQRM